MGILIAYLLGILTAAKAKNQPTNHANDPPNSPYSQTPSDRPLTVVCVPPTETDEERAEKEKKKRHKTIKFWVEIASAIILLGYFGVTILIWWANNQAAEAAKNAADTASRTMKIAYRPRVIIASLGPSVTVKQGQSGINFIEDGRIRMNSNISNIGPLTARSVHYFTFWEIIGNRENAKRLGYREATEPFGYPKAILPKSTGYDSSAAFFTDKLTPEQITAIGHGAWTEFSVLITYDDDFGETHGTEYCDMFVIGGPQDVCPWNIRND